MANIDIVVGWDGSQFYVTYDNLDDGVAATTTTFSGQDMGNAAGVTSDLERYSPPPGGTTTSFGNYGEVGFFIGRPAGNANTVDPAKQFYMSWGGTDDDITVRFDDSFHFMTDAAVTAYNGGTGPYAGVLDTTGTSIADVYGSRDALTVSLQMGAIAPNDLTLELDAMALAGDTIVQHSHLHDWYTGDRQTGSSSVFDRGVEDLFTKISNDFNTYGYVGEFPNVDIDSLAVTDIYVGAATFNAAVNPPCFTAGTVIRTPSGDKKVEDLRIGDEIVTMGRGVQKVRWIGKTPVTEETQKQFPEKYAPIRIRKGVLGNRRDLLVSPQHRMLVQLGDFQYVDLALEKFDQTEALVAAKSLVDGENIIVDTEQGDVEYFHVMFDQHEVIFAEDSPTESYHLGEYGQSVMSETTRHELFDFFPELEWEIQDIAPAKKILRPGQIRQAAKRAKKQLHSC